MTALYKKNICRGGKIVNLLLIIICCINFPLFAQKNNDANRFVHLCHDTIVKFGMNGSGSVRDIPEPGSLGNPGTRINPYPDTSIAKNRGCLLLGETFSNWFLIPIQADGKLAFTIGSDSTQTGFYDWILFPFNGVSEEDIGKNLVAPVKCNWNGADWGGTGLLAKNDVPVNSHISNFEEPFDVLRGETYLLCVNNNDAIDANVKIIFTGTGIGFYEPPLVSIAGDSIICHNETTVLEAQKTGITSDYLWSTGDTSRFVEVKPEESSTYTVKVKANHCGNIEGFDKKNIEVLPQPEPDSKIFPEQDKFDIATNISFTDVSTTIEGEITDRYWDFGDGTFSTNKTAFHTFSDTGTFNVTFIVTNSLGCKDTLLEKIKVDPILELFKPNAFTPNGDTKNDLFYISNIGITEFTMTIYDRWGKEVFYTRNINDFWNGRYFNKGQLVQIGAYVYDIYYKDYSGYERNEQGTISVLR